MYKKIVLHTALPGLPVSAAISAQKVLYPQTPHPSQFFPPGLSPLIMVIDDSITIQKIVQVCLRREGFSVVVFPDGIQAMTWLSQANSHVPDLIILDIGLPKLDGYEIARYLKAKPQFGNTIIIMLSSRDRVIDRLKGRLVGAKDYITKPFQTETITSVVKSYVGSPTVKRNTMQK